MAKSPAKNKPNKSFEQTLWESADKLRGTVASSEYKHIVLSLIFLKFLSDKFDERVMDFTFRDAFLRLLTIGEKEIRDVIILII